MDLDDINKNAKDGLHTAAMAGSWMSIVNGFGGMRLVDGTLVFNPALPKQWESYRFKIVNQGAILDILVDGEGVQYTLLEGETLTVKHKDQGLTLAWNEPVRV
ncbi:Alpha,alpha-trehalose phosphorylase [compost metagenome]